MEDIIIEQNPWWKNKGEILEDEKVKIALSKKKKLAYSFKEEKNKLFIGPRQVGKTTFFKLLIYDLLFNRNVDPKNICYFSCELLKDYREIVEIFRKFSILAKPKYVFFDEVSFVENWNRSIKYLLDSGMLKDKILYVTGSSSMELKKEKLPGRNIEVEYFLPLSFREFAKLFGSKNLRNKLLKTEIKFEKMNGRKIFQLCKEIFAFKEELDKLFHYYIQCGGFPRAFYELMENGKIKNETYEIYWNWIISDIAKLERSEKITISVLRGIIKNYGTRFSLSSIAKENEIGSHVTVREYLEVLENLIIIKNFYTFDLNKKSVIFRKMRKAYFIDPFVLHSCSFMLFGKTYNDISKIVEGIVVESVTRKIGTLKAGFYHNKKEIDLCFNDFGIEVKFQEKVTKKDFPEVNVKNKILISKNDFELEENSNLVIIPASIFLACV